MTCGACNSTSARKSSASREAGESNTKHSGMTREVGKPRQDPIKYDCSSASRAQRAFTWGYQFDITSSRQVRQPLRSSFRATSAKG